MHTCWHSHEHSHVEGSDYLVSQLIKWPTPFQEVWFPHSFLSFNILPLCIPPFCSSVYRPTSRSLTFCNQPLSLPLLFYLPLFPFIFLPILSLYSYDLRYSLVLFPLLSHFFSSSRCRRCFGMLIRGTLEYPHSSLPTWLASVMSSMGSSNIPAL